MRKILRKTLRILFLMLLIFGGCFFAIDLWFEFYGFPVILQSTIRSRINKALPISCSISWIRGGIFSGLKFEQVRFQHQNKGSLLSCSLPQISCSMNLFSLLASEIRVNSLQLNNVTAYYRHGPDTPPLYFENGYFSLQFSRNNTLNLIMNVKTEGIRMQSRCDLENFSSGNLENTVRYFQTLLGLSAPDSSESAFNPSAVIRRLHSYQFGDDDANLNFSLTGDLLRPDDLQSQGYFSVNTALLDNITVNKCRGHFTLQNYIMTLSDLHLIFGQGEILKSNIIVNLKRKTITATCRGDLTPSIALQCIGQQSSSLLNNFTFHNPLHVDAVLAETPWDLQQARLDMKVQFRNIDILATNIHHGHLDIHGSADTLNIDNILIAGDFYEQNRITGNISYNLDKKLLSGQIDGDLPLLQILADNNFSISKLSPRQIQQKHQLHLQLSPSSLELAELKLNGYLKQSELKIMGRNFAGYEIPFSLQNGILKISNGKLTLPDGKNAAEISCHTNLPSLLENQHEQIALQLRLYAFSSGLKWEPAMNLNAKFLLNLKNLTLALPEGKGDIHISRLYSTYVPILSLPQDEILALISCEKTPASFTCRIPEFSLKAPETIAIEGRAEARDSRFNRLAVHHATSDFHLTPNQFSFKNIRAVVDNQETLELDLYARLYPFCIEIKNGKMIGRPNLISNFIFDEESEALYRDIWKDVRWNTDTLPCFTLQHLLYSESEDDLSWALEMKASARIRNARYNGYPIPEVNARIQMNLPESLEISPIIITTEDGAIDGYCRLLLANETICQFAVNEKAGTVDVIRLLDAIYPDWKKTCPDLHLPQKSRISCRGSFSLNPMDPGVRLSGTFAVPELSYQTLKAEKLSGIWNYQNEKLFWDIRQAEMQKGHLRCSGIFDWNTNTGESQFNLSRIPISEIMAFNPRPIKSSDRKKASPLSEKAMKGFINCSGNIHFYKNWVGKNLLLEGSSHVSVREADLWKIPIMSSLGELIAMGSFNFFSKNDIGTLGTISELDADMEFHGERLFVSKLYTNGTIIALNGSGEYSLLTDRLNFNINGEALKSVNILAFFLKPLSWVFQAELTGTPEAPKWKLRTALRKIFSTE